MGVEGLTILIPTAGRRWGELEQCLDSIWNQTVLPYAVTVIHNHGLPIPRDIRAHEVGHIRVEGPIYHGFNAGVKSVLTDWLMLLGDDDRLPRDDWLKPLLNKLGSGESWNYVCHLCIPTERRGRISRGYLPRFDGRETDIAGEILRNGRGLVAHSGAAYRKELHRTVGPYPEHLRSQGDTWWIARAAIRGELRLRSYKGDGPIIGADDRDRVSGVKDERARTFKLIERMVARA
jgi:glycosyltransferase involved in cell wall biosynthesis